MTGLTRLTSLAPMIRTSTRTVRLLPTGSNSCSWMTRRSFTWVSSESHLQADAEVGQRERGFQDEEAQNVPGRLVQEDGRSIERDDAAQGSGDSVEQRLRVWLEMMALLISRRVRYRSAATAAGSVEGGRSIVVGPLPVTHGQPGLRAAAWSG